MFFSVCCEHREGNENRTRRKKQAGEKKEKRKKRRKKPHTNLRVDVRVDPQQHPRDLAGGPGRSRHVGQVELRVDVDQRAALDGQAQLPGQLAVAVEDGALGVEAGRERDLELVARDQDASGAQFLEVLQNAQVVVGLDRVADDGVDALESFLVGREVGSQLRLRVEVKGARLGLGADVVVFDRVAVEESVLLPLVEASALGGGEDGGGPGGSGGGRRGGAGADGGGGGGGGAALLWREEREEREEVERLEEGKKKAAVDRLNKRRVIANCVVDEDAFCNRAMPMAFNYRYLCRSTGGRPDSWSKCDRASEDDREISPINRRRRRRRRRTKKEHAPWPI